MVVSFLQSQLDANKPIKIADNNIGRLFIEFLFYYGLIFDHTKYVIYTYLPKDMALADKDQNNYFLVNKNNKFIFFRIICIQGMNLLLQIL